MDRRKKKLRGRRRNRLAVVLLALMLFFIWLGAKNYMNMEGLGFPGSGDGGRLSACLEDLHSTSAALVDAGTGGIRREQAYLSGLHDKDHDCRGGAGAYLWPG